MFFPFIPPPFLLLPPPSPHVLRLTLPHCWQKSVTRNTLTVQYNPLIEEVWDEHFKVTCEYDYEFRKTVTFPFMDVT